MDGRIFKQVWETEYIKARVDKVAEAVKDGSYDLALDILSMIQDKATAAKRLITEKASPK